MFCFILPVRPKFFTDTATTLQKYHTLSREDLTEVKKDWNRLQRRGLRRISLWVKQLFYSAFLRLLFWGTKLRAKIVQNFFRCYVGAFFLV